ncbi:hypothetical protein [Pelobacter seleniigenes]|uniref:hypothetical protein n=1 Tax=Pelobacter seleniigenes TaxID=407188 RepID=UPI0004A75902|nr:hypothetical protein [Pelobacter seleniigenes]
MRFILYFKKLTIKQTVLFSLLLLVAIGIYLHLSKERDVYDIVQGKKHYGTLLLSCEIEGLPIFIDEQQVGVTRKEVQTFKLPVRGVYGTADHEVVVRQEVDAEREYYFCERFSFNRYIDVEKKPVKQIVLSLSPPEDHTFPPIQQALDLRLKPDLLARKTGLVRDVKLKHNRAWNMTEDESCLYVLTRAEKDLNRPSEREPVEGEYVEVYDKKTLAFIGEQQLQPIFVYDSFDTYNSIAVDDDTIYIGNRVAQLLRLEKQSLKPKRAAPEEIDGWISGLSRFQDYLIAYGEGDRITVFKNDELLYVIDEKKHYPDNIEQIHDYDDYNRINNVFIHKGLLYATNFRGFINVYALEDGRFVKQINTIKYEEEWNYVVGRNIEAAGVYQERYLYFSIDLAGLLILDSQTGAVSQIPTLFPHEKEYSELFHEELDVTKQTDIYKMVFYRHFLLFSEVNARNEFLYAYDLESRKIVHTFKGHRGDITELFLHGNHLTGLSSEGRLYRWDLSVLEQPLAAE